MKKASIFIIIILIFNGCTNSDKTCWNNEALINLMMADKENSVIPDSLYSFFPDSLLLANTFKPIVTTDNAGAYPHDYDCRTFTTTYNIWYGSIVDTQLHRGLLESYKNRSLKSINPFTDDYFIIDDEETLKQEYDSSILKEKYNNYTGEKIIPDFHRLSLADHNDGDSISLCGLTEGYEILILKYGNDYIMPEKYKCEWYLLPEHLKSGYRSGVAYNDSNQNIIYWTVCW